MPENIENNARTPRSRLKGPIKRLDFAMRRPAAKKPAEAPKPAPVPKPAPAPKPVPAKKPAPKPTSAKPTPVKKPAPKPAPAPKSVPKPPVSRGMFIDFAPNQARPTTSRSQASRIASERMAAAPRPAPKPAAKKPIVEKPAPRATLSVEKETITVKTTSAKPAPRPARPAARPAPKPAARPVSRPAQPAVRPAPARPAVRRTPVQREPVYDDFDEELEALESINDDIFNDIDGPGDDIDAIEREIEADASDFVKAPKPLFEDPLVMLSKARDERRHKKEAKEAAEFKEQKKQEAKKAAGLAPYTLGGRSPFLTSVNVEKRPLSAPVSAADGPLAATSVGAAGAIYSTTSKSAKSSSDKATKRAKSAKNKSTRSKASRISWVAKNPEQSPVKLQAPGAALIESTYKNQMSRQLDRDAKEIHRQAALASAPEGKGPRTGLIIAIILTVLLGAGVGAVIYLIFFQ